MSCQRNWRAVGTGPYGAGGSTAEAGAEKFEPTKGRKANATPQLFQKFMPVTLPSHSVSRNPFSARHPIAPVACAASEELPEAQGIAMIPRNTRSVMKQLGSKVIALGLLFANVTGWSQSSRFLPGQRALLDAHNCYPYEGKWADRVDRALATGLPVGIEMDLVWDLTKPGEPRVVVRHGGKAKGDEPALGEYFFARVRPVVEKALRENNRDHWPLLTLNLNDLRASEPEFFVALWKLLDDYEPWLCTAAKTADPSQLSSLEVRPILILTSDGAQQAKVFYENVPPGGRLRMFAAGSPDRNADNFRRWLNYPWSKVEPEGQPRAGDWSPKDAARLKALVDDAHKRGYWIRFYTLNGHSAREVPGRGWTPSYNFGSLEAVTVRWKAAQSAAVDFIASDQYEECARALVN